MSDEYKNMSDHDLLVTVARDVCWLKKILGNHLSHHKALTIALVSITGTAIVALLIALL